MASLKVIYGRNILANFADRFGKYVVLTTSSPWRIAEAMVAGKPEEVLIVPSLERDFLEQAAAELPEFDSVVGIGGGMVIDATKYMAYKRGGRLFLVPSITSSDAPFTSNISVRENNTNVGLVTDLVPDAVIIDYDLISAAEPRWNRSGFGDLYCLRSSIKDWERACKAGKGTWNPQLGVDMRRFLADLEELAPEVKKMSPDGIRGLVEALVEASDFIQQYPESRIWAGFDHLFAWNLERVTGKHFVHGEIVALGAIIAAVMQGEDAADICRVLAQAGVAYRPQDLGTKWEEIRYCLDTVKEYNDTVRHWYTLLNEVPITKEIFQEIQRVVIAEPGANL